MYEMGLREMDEMYEMGLREIERQERVLAGEIAEHDIQYMILINKMSNIKSSLCMIQRII